MSSNHYDTPESTDVTNTTEQDGEFASADDFRVRRNGEGDALPQTIDTDLGKVRVVPMSYGDVEQYFTGDDSQSISSDQIASLVQHHLIQPDLSEDAGGKITGEYIKNMKPLAPRELIFAILTASGIDADVQMQGDSSAEIDMQGN